MCRRTGFASLRRRCVLAASGSPSFSSQSTAIVSICLLLNGLLTHFAVCRRGQGGGNLHRPTVTSKGRAALFVGRPEIDDVDTLGHLSGPDCAIRLSKLQSNLID